MKASVSLSTRRSTSSRNESRTAPRQSRPSGRDATMDARARLGELEHEYHRMCARLSALNDEFLVEAILIDSLIEDIEDFARNADSYAAA